MTAKDLPGSTEPTVDYTYDLLGRLTSAATSSQTVEFTYDALGRRVGETGLDGLVTSTYDPAGRRTSLSAYAYYAAYDYLVTGELLHVTTDLTAAAFGYDALGRRTSLTRGNGTAMSWSYDAAGRLSGMSDDADGSADDRSVTFTTNPAGQIVGRTESNDAYAFTGLANGSATDTHNGLNQVTATGSASVSHDARGNTSAIGSSSYGYDSENRLISAPGGVSLSYDPLGRLAQVTDASGLRRFIHDGMQAMFVQDVPNAGSAVTDAVVYGDTPNSPLVSYTTNGRVWHHADERGSIVAQSADGGTVTAINRYDDYGRPQGGSVSGRFGYTGQAWLPELGMYDYHARVYNPGLGRFMQTDPIGYAAGMNLYGYVEGDPVNLIDPSGNACAFVGGHAFRLCGASLDRAIAEMGLAWEHTFENKWSKEPEGRRDYGTRYVGSRIISATSSTSFFSDPPGIGHNGGPPLEDDQPEILETIWNIISYLPRGAVGAIGTLVSSSPAEAPAPPMRPNGVFSFTSNPSILGHIFRNAPGHFTFDSQHARAALIMTAEYGHSWGRDSFGQSWYSYNLPGGLQIWAVANSNRQIVHG